VLERRSPLLLPRDKSARFILALWTLRFFAGVPGFSQNAASPLTRVDVKANALLDQAIQALGGPAFLNFKTLSARGRVFSLEEGEATGMAPFESDTEFPDKRRFAYGSGKPVVLINNGDQGWELDRYGLIRQKRDRIERWQLANRYSLENLLRVVVREPGVLVQDAGVDFIDLLPVQALDIFDSRHIRVRLYLQQSTHLPVRIAYRVQDPQTQEWDVFADAYSDYRNIQGIQTPMHITRYEDNERVLEMFRNSAQYGKEYAPSTFEPAG